MMKLNLQLFAETVPGKKIIYKFRLLENAEKEAAWTIAFSEENENDISVDADSTATKDGSVRTPSVPEIEITATALLAKGDDKITKIKNAMLKNKLFEIWEINLEEQAETAGKYKGTYYQGYCTEWDLSSSAEDIAEAKLTFGVNGIGADGECTVTDDEVEEASYVFTDTVKKEPDNKTGN